ncbi:hypothetical protein LXL04_033539 [Taraxacum kok-saghyz]
MSSSVENLEKYRIPINEILRVTRNFSSETLIGDGGFGLVHKGQLSEEWQKRIVAIKRLNRDGYQGNNEFQNELKMVSSFKHPNIITFIGYCDDNNEMIIVYDYAKNASLDRHLQRPEKMRSLTWGQRLKICLGAARGLKYLHSGLGNHNRVIHRDVKSANILLDENLEAKICDFGLSRFGARNQEETQLLTKAAGTRFYMDPLYAERSRLTKESDVYSFGVVMFEMSSGTLVYHEKCFGDDDKPQYLIDVVRSYYDDDKKAAGGLEKLIDPDIKDHINMKSFHTFTKVAHECLSLKLKERPTMARIIRKIEQALTFQLNHQESTSTITTRSLDTFLIPLEEIILAIQNFNLENNSGQLYGQWQNRTVIVAKLYPNKNQNEYEIKEVLRIISSFHHQNISRFIGYFYEANERILVHEYVVNGSIASYLDEEKKRHLTWPERLKICLGVARGLQYLHLRLGEDHKATQGNINSADILLDETMEPKICLFGFPNHGLRYYKPNEHISDMYSFGVLVFEILSGIPARELDRHVEPENQMDVLEGFYHNNQLGEFIDSNIRDQIDNRCLNIFIEIAYECIKRGKQRHIMKKQPGGMDRRAPFTMDEVVDRIEDAADIEGNEN